MARPKTDDYPEVVFEKPAEHADDLARLAELRFRQDGSEQLEPMSRSRSRRRRAG